MTEVANTDKYKSSGRKPICTFLFDNMVWKFLECVTVIKITVTIEIMTGRWKMLFSNEMNYEFLNSMNTNGLNELAIYRKKIIQEILEFKK